MIGKGYSVKSAINEMSMISEGFYATKNAYEISIANKTRFDIITAAHDILYKNDNPKKIMKSLSMKLN